MCLNVTGEQKQHTCTRQESQNKQAYIMKGKAEGNYTT